MRRTLLAILALSVAVSGCAGSGGHQAAPTSVPRPVSPNPDVVPAVITPAYVDAVFVQLNKIYGDAVRLEVATGQESSPVISDLRAIYANPQFQREENVFEGELPHLKRDVRPDPGNRILTVSKIISKSPTCVTTVSYGNASAVVIYPVSPVKVYVTILPKPTKNDPSHINPTPWVISWEENGPPPSGC